MTSALWVLLTVGCSSEAAPGDPNVPLVPGGDGAGDGDGDDAASGGTEPDASLGTDAGAPWPTDDAGSLAGRDASTTGGGPAQRCAEIMKAEPNSFTTTPYPGGRWTVPEPTYGAVVESGIRIEMSDGVELVGDVAYPTKLGTNERAPGEFPVILTQNPYGTPVGAPVFGGASGELFVTHGYIFASIDVRGTGRSEGTHDMFSPREAEDGAALVAWAAELQGSDGRVGLQGCSQLGINQLETATLLGPNSPVKAMIPACASGDFYRDTAFDNGIPTIVGSILGGEGDLSYYRDYWKTRDRLARAPAIAAADIPMLLWSGWHEPGALGSLELYTAVQNLHFGRPATAPITAETPVSGRFQVILGDWGHAMGLDKGIELQWFDTWIKGIDTGLPTETDTPLHLAERSGTDPDRWISTRCYPIIEAYTPFYLASDQRLSEHAVGGSEGQDMLAWGEGALADSIEYTSEPFTDGAMVAGPMAAQLKVSSSNANLQLVFDLFDQADDGTRVLITHGSILGSRRRTDPERSWSDENGLPARPYLTLDQDEPLTPEEATSLEVPLWPTVWSIEPGHRLVLKLAVQPDSASCANPLGVPVGCFPTQAMKSTLSGGVYSIHHEGSLLSLPLLEHGALPTAEHAVSPTGAESFPLPIVW